MLISICLEGCCKVTLPKGLDFLMNYYFKKAVFHLNLCFNFFVNSEKPFLNLD